MTNQQIKELKITNQILALLVVIFAVLLGVVVGKQKAWLKNQPEMPIPQRVLNGEEVLIQPTKEDLGKPLNQIIQNRRSNQQIVGKALRAEQLASLMWAMQGITASWGERAVPTTRAAFPLTVNVIVKNIEGIKPGLYIFDPSTTSLKQVEGFEQGLAESAFASNLSLSQAPAVIAISGSKTKLKNKMEGIEHNELLYFEAGHAVQNAALEAETLGLSISPVSQLDETINGVFKSTTDEMMVSLFAVGYPKAE